MLSYFWTFSWKNAVKNCSHSHTDTNQPVGKPYFFSSFWTAVKNRSNFHTSGYRQSKPYVMIKKTNGQGRLTKIKWDYGFPGHTSSFRWFLALTLLFALTANVPCLHRSSKDWRQNKLFEMGTVNDAVTWLRSGARGAGLEQFGDLWTGAKNLGKPKKLVQNGGFNAFYFNHRKGTVIDDDPQWQAQFSDVFKGVEKSQPKLNTRGYTKHEQKTHHHCGIFDRLDCWPLSRLRFAFRHFGLKLCWTSLGGDINGALAWIPWDPWGQATPWDHDYLGSFEVPLILALYAYVQKAGSSCIAPALEGRIVQTPLGPKGGGGLGGQGYKPLQNGTQPFETWV